MKSWNFVYHMCAGLCLLLISTTSYTHEIQAAGLDQLETGAIWLPHRENYHLPSKSKDSLFEVNGNRHSLPNAVLTQCGYKTAQKPPKKDPATHQQIISMRIITDKAVGQSLPWPGSAVTGDTRRHAIVYQTTSEPSFSFPRTSSDTTSPPACLYFFRLTAPQTAPATAAATAAEPIIPQTPATQLVLKLTREKGNIRYDPLYFELSSPLAAASSVHPAPSAQKIYNIALMLNSSAMYRTASTTTHQFGYFQLPWALVIKSLELTPNKPCQIIWSKSSLHASYCSIDDTLQVLMPTYPTQPLPQFDQSLLLSNSKAEHPPAKPFALPVIPPKPIVFAMLTTLESGFTPYWRENLDSLTMLSGPDHTSRIFTQTLSFIDQGS